MSSVRNTLAMAAAQVYYKVTGLLLLGLLSRTLSTPDLGGVLWAQSLCESLTLVANLNLGPNLMRRVSGTPQDITSEVARLLGLRLAGALAYLLFLAIISVASNAALRPILFAFTVATLLEDLYFFFGTLFLSLGQIRYNLGIGLTVQTAYVVFLFVALTASPPTAVLGLYMLVSVLRGVALLLTAIFLTKRSLPTLGVRWEPELLKEQVPLFGAALISALRGRAETLTAGWLLSLSQVASFGLTQRLIVAASIIPVSVLSGFGPALARSGPTQASRRQAVQVLLALLVLGSVVGIFLFLFSAPIARLLFGPNPEVGTLLRLTAPLLPLAFLEGFIAGILQLWHREKIVLRVGLVGMVVFVLLGLLAVSPFGVAGLVYAQIAATLLRTLWMGWEMFRCSLPSLTNEERGILEGLPPGE